MNDEIEEAEKKLILLLGLQEKPIDELFIQKELFLLTRTLKELEVLFDFKKHYQGPFSEVIHDSLDDPLYFENSFSKMGNKFLLSEKGKEQFKEISLKEKKESLVLIKFIREVYEKLEEDELLFIIYCSYPEFMEKSNRCKFLFNNEIKLKIIKNLLKKGLISEEKAEELKWC
ncbi:MAG TPA: hypothetical protein VJ438_01095 [Candidatus Nanoarchaeia archaeon]|nr:hypothetical protein [Candidatus Nanoarchaeia archaeon]